MNKREKVRMAKAKAQLKALLKQGKDLDRQIWMLQQLRNKVWERIELCDDFIRNA